ncbi:MULTISPECIES: sulfatase [unclassified Lentimonas]|uniref:sulfatase family protein n=1 Tax=unclassified Lentimonas TaxID=2630993 RepID=UPI00132AE1FB|nr:MULTISPECIES: sulfatase [unclassified Lentimonas]CAA6679334.1 Choline-sulfatase (EC [Lentimonas sp. CC4]CAA6686371.1 Choline-sulfatase (EC [Lentimonas sp. CC6]CAA7076145.1 Choline-sulfatase (EC [Lentimonas sp. CC4]CAA7170862.1 Choline-sulfatase (EC [Lentimonas sp. CC21]CAA7181196.1 Choline-sulfatase (EC [Lentimonas sp. CC8]
MNSLFKSVLIGLLAFAGLQGLSAADSNHSKRPNIIFILSDDHRFDAMGFMDVYPGLETPNMDRIRAEGAHMKNAFVTLSMCAPSRSSFLTGLYPHTHGVSNNNEAREPDWSKTPSFGQYLQDAGYHTGYIGKFHLAHHNDPRPGFDHWVSFTGQGHYNGNVLGVNGKVVKAPGYVTDVLTRYAKEFINQERGDKPFMLYLSHKAVHGPFTPAKRHQDLYPDARYPMPETLREDRSNKPQWQRSIEWFKTVFVNGELTYATENNRVLEWDESTGYIGRTKPYLQSLSAVDEGIGEILDLLEKRGELDNTFIIYAGDNGYLLGEHGRSDKRVAYNESIRIPMIIRYPRLIQPGTTVEDYVLNIDLAPTLIDLASAPEEPTLHGESMLPLFAGQNEGWRDGFLYNYNWDLHPLIPTIVAYRTPEFLLSTTPNRDDLYELYDLQRDPLETNNVFNNPEYASQRKQMFAQLEAAKEAVDFTLEVPDPIVGRWHAEEDKTHEFVPEKKAMQSDSRVEIPTEKTFNLSLGTVSFELEFTPESDGIVFSQYFFHRINAHLTEGNGFILYVEDGAVNLCFQRRQVSYILRDDQVLTGKPVKAKFSFSSDGKWIKMQVNGGEEWSTSFTDPIPRLYHEKEPRAMLGKPSAKQLPDTIQLHDGFNGSFEELTVQQTKQ